jgi:beta-lactamase class A
VSRRTSPRRSTRRSISIAERAKPFLPLRSWRLQLAGVVVAVAAAIMSAQSFASAREREAAPTYLIQPGDTLSAIASNTGVPLDKLVGLNDIKNPDVIISGQTLSLTGSASVAVSQTSAVGSSTAGGRYTVKSGDTLWDISVANGVALDSLIKLNNVNDADQLTIGQVLQLPTAIATQHSANSAAQKPKPTATSTPVAAPTATATAVPKPKPTQVPAQPQPSPLQQRVAAEALRVGGQNVRVGAAAINLVSGEKVNLRADDSFPSASVMKLPILVELERQIAAGTLSWTESLRTEAGAMIAVSDNSAANQIAGAIHSQSVNDTMAKLGLGSTKFLNLFTDARSAANPGVNTTTPGNMARLLELIATDQIVRSQVSADIRTLLARNADRSKLVRLLPADARVAHKSGWYEGVANDVGIITVDRLPTRWVIAVFTENVPDAETGNQIVAAISRAIYDAWAP